MIVVILVLLTLIASGGWYLFYRTAAALFKFDAAWTGLMKELQTYSIDLKRMASGDLLTDHPEVLAFHKRNMGVLEAIERVVADAKIEPVGQRQLPRPDVE